MKLLRVPTTESPETLWYSKPCCKSLCV